VVNVVKSLDSKISVTFGCQDLLLPFKDLVNANEVIHNVGEFILHIQDGFPLKHPVHFTLLDQGMLPCPLHISCAFMGNLKDVPHLLYKSTL